jgi:putative ABC transport system permease protein
VIGLIVLEAALLALAGGLVGIATGAGLAALLEHLDLMRGKIDAIFSVPFYGGVALLSVLLGIAGGLLPALKGARMVPSKALRQE